MERTREPRERPASLEHDDARQTRLAMETDLKSDKKTHKCTEDTAADQAMNGDSCSAKRLQAGPTYLTSFGLEVEPPALPRWDDVLIDKGTAVPKPCLSPVGMRTLTAAGGLLPAGKASTATRITYYQPRIWFCPTEETSSERTSVQYVSYYNSLGG